MLLELAQWLAKDIRAFNVFGYLTLRAVLEESAATGVQVEVQGSGLARNQEPPPGTILPPGARVRVQFAR